MTNRRITLVNPRLTLLRRACRFVAGPSMSDAARAEIDRLFSREGRS